MKRVKKAQRTRRTGLDLDISIAKVLTRPSYAGDVPYVSPSDVTLALSPSLFFFLPSLSLSLNSVLFLSFSPRSIAKFHLGRRCLSFRGSSENQFRRLGVNATRYSVASCRAPSQAE